jgi:hypothetical protein
MPYTNKKADLPEGFIDLGEKVQSMEIKPAMEMEKSESIHYPSLYFDNAEGLSKLPKEGTAMIHFKKVMEKKETMMRDGKEVKRHCVELQICGIKPESVSETTSTDEEKEDDEDAIEMGLKAAAGEAESEDKYETEEED